MTLQAILLAAGRGTRMKSELPKVLHRLAGKPLLFYPLDAAFEVGVEHAVVVTSGEPAIDEALRGRYGAKVSTVRQDPPRGTGDAARVGLKGVTAERVLVLCGDTPLVRGDDLAPLLQALDAPGRALAFLTATPSDPRGYGRVLRDAAGGVLAIREQRDLRGEAELAVREVNAGMYAARVAALGDALAKLSPDNAQGEYYLTDAVQLLAGNDRVAAVLGATDALVGVNDRLDLARAEEQLLERIRDRHRRAGVTVHGQARIDDEVEIGPDSDIGSGVELRGRTRVGRATRLDTGCVVTDSRLGDGVVVKPYTVITESSVGDGAVLGPFAHLRPESDIGAEAHIGNFVETKKTRVARGAKANHLSYLGDAEVGERVNIGAGTIVCNYDGFRKHRTVIGEGAFIGSDSQLVAPVTIGKNVIVASGTTVTQDVPDDALAIGRAKQENKLGYAPRLRARLNKKP